ncbi:MmgE/PrpD family protein [Streptomyces sp. HNM0575]|uniref:MmgE/PrpD family protein n=1 Tax=Streptomyces sp. HNM0575 TaxID=2716338 RepID=UPI00145DCD72|nr:MmgE/PrpD family protein [Streptomyces sp. HNM0575]NLU72238.1 MmgE/PrpD family protein [Streptomyces sp. HNM0575]
MADVSASLVRFAVTTGQPVPDGLRSAVHGLHAPPPGTASGTTDTPSPAATSAPADGTGLEKCLAALRSAYPPEDARTYVLEAAAALTHSGVHPLVAATAAVAANRNAARAAEATVLGCEVACRLAASLGVRPDALAVVGAALAGSTAPTSGLHALGLAATQSTTVSAGDDERDEVTALRAALAAADGLEAALLGERGLTAPPHPLEGRRGLLALLSPEAEPRALTDNLGTRWLAEDVLRTT